MSEVAFPATGAAGPRDGTARGLPAGNPASATRATVGSVGLATGGEIGPLVGVAAAPASGPATSWPGFKNGRSSSPDAVSNGDFNGTPFNGRSPGALAISELGSRAGWQTVVVAVAVAGEMSTGADSKPPVLTRPDGCAVGGAESWVVAAGTSGQKRGGAPGLAIAGGGTGAAGTCASWWEILAGSGGPVGSGFVARERPSDRGPGAGGRKVIGAGLKAGGDGERRRWGGVSGEAGARPVGGNFGWRTH